MNDLKNINTTSDFQHRTGLIVWLKSKKNAKRLKNYGNLHYISNKMDYALLYADTKKLEKTIKKIEKENYVQSVEKSPLKDLPVRYDDVLKNMQKEIDQKKKEEKEADISDYSTLEKNDW